MCNGDDCKCTKPKNKTVEVVENRIAPMYSNGKGVSFSMSPIVQAVAIRMHLMFGHFTVAEDDSGELIIKTGMFREKEQLALPAAGETCGELCECEGECSGVQAFNLE